MIASRAMKRRMALEIDAGADLHLAAAGDAGHLAEAEVVDGRGDASELMAIEEVEEFGAELEAGAFLEIEVLLEADVLIDGAEVADLGVAAGGGAKGEGRRHGELALDEVGVGGREAIGEVEIGFVKARGFEIARSDVGAVDCAVPAAGKRLRLS